VKEWTFFPFLKKKRDVNKSGTLDENDDRGKDAILLLLRLLRLLLRFAGASLCGGGGGGGRRGGQRSERHTERRESSRIRGQRVRRSAQQRGSGSGQSAAHQHAPSANERELAVLGGRAVHGQTVRRKGWKPSRGWREIGEHICNGGELDDAGIAGERGSQSGKRRPSRAVRRAQSESGQFLSATVATAVATVAATFTATVAAASASAYSYPKCELALVRVGMFSDRSGVWVVHDVGQIQHVRRNA